MKYGIALNFINHLLKKISLRLSAVSMYWSSENIRKPPYVIYGL